MAIRKIVYVTSSQFKKEECELLVKICKLSDGTAVKDLVEFEFQNVSIVERLEVDIAAMVTSEVREAYGQIRRPCIVEHAGLIFDDYKDKWYPGGLTKPMWNTLGSNFIDETKSGGRKAVAKAVVAYCDGMKIKTFVGEMAGTLATSPQGRREFYWDTVFIPDDPSCDGKTYAQIIEDTALGLTYKISKLSQSAKAIIAFIEYLRSQPPSLLWP